MNSCILQMMSPLWPPVCKWNSQQSIEQEVIVVYSLGTPLCREHSGRFSPPSSLNVTLKPLFCFLQPVFRIQLNLFLFFLAMKCWGNPPRMSIPIIFSLLCRLSKQKKRMCSSDELRAWRLFGVWCKTWPMLNLHYLPSVKLKAVSTEEQPWWVVLWHQLVKAFGLYLAKGNLQGCWSSSKTDFQTPSCMDLNRMVRKMLSS